MDKMTLIKRQVAQDIAEGHSECYAVTAAIFNHGLNPTREALKLPKPRIRSIHNRADCWDRAQLAAAQMINRRDLVLYQIVNARGRVVNGVWNGKTPMTLSEATRKMALMHAQGRGTYILRKVTK